MSKKTVGELFNIDKPTMGYVIFENQGADADYEFETELDPLMSLDEFYERCVFHNFDQVRETYIDCAEELGVHIENYDTIDEFEAQFEKVCKDFIVGARYCFCFNDKTFEFTDEDFFKVTHE